MQKRPGNEHELPQWDCNYLIFAYNRIINFRAASFAFYRYLDFNLV